MTVNNENKKNILIVHNYYQISGGEDTVVANEKKMLEKHGHKVSLYSRSNVELKQMSKLQKVFLPITTVFNPKTYKEIKNLIRQESIEIVHVHNTLNLVSPAVYYAANGNVIEDKDLERFRLDSPVVRQILYQMNKEMGAVDNIKVDASEKEISYNLH